LRIPSRKKVSSNHQSLTQDDLAHPFHEIGAIYSASQLLWSKCSSRVLKTLCYAAGNNRNVIKSSKLQRLKAPRKSKWNALHQLHRSFPAHGDYRIPERLGRKSSFAIRVIILIRVSLCADNTGGVTYLPFSSGYLNFLFAHLRMLNQKSWSNPRFKIGEELLPPQSQSLRIVASNILNTFHDQCAFGAFSDVVHKLSNGRKMSS
jgi:hypothetical protein